MSIRDATTDSVESKPTTETRTCRISRHPDGKPLGISIFLSAEQLQNLDVDLEQDAVAYEVRDGKLTLFSPDFR